MEKNKKQNSKSTTKNPGKKSPVQNSSAKSPKLDFKKENLDLFFRKNIKLVFSLFIFSLVVIRVSYYASIVKSPLYNLYNFQDSDNKFFDDWAKYLNTDWLNANTNPE